MQLGDLLILGGFASCAVAFWKMWKLRPATAIEPLLIGGTAAALIGFILSGPL